MLTNSMMSYVIFSVDLICLFQHTAHLSICQAEDKMRTETAALLGQVSAVCFVCLLL